MELELETEVKIARQMTSTAPTVSNFEEVRVVIMLILSSGGSVSEDLLLQNDCQRRSIAGVAEKSIIPGGAQVGLRCRAGNRGGIALEY